MSDDTCRYHPLSERHLHICKMKVLKYVYIKILSSSDASVCALELLDSVKCTEMDAQAPGLCPPLLPSTQGSTGQERTTAPRDQHLSTRPSLQIPSLAQVKLLIEFQMLSHTFLSKYHGKKT